MNTTTEQIAQSMGLAAGVLASPFDGGALMGAFAGSALYALNVKECSTKKKLGNMALSVFVGYFSSGVVGELTGINDAMVNSFIASALLVYVFGQILETDLLERFKK